MGAYLGEATVSGKGNGFSDFFKNSGKPSKINISGARNGSARHPVRRGGLAWKVAFP